MSWDSIEQYRQAKLGQYSDWFPPIMSISLAGMMRLGGDIQHAILLQCISGLLGVYFLALASIRRLSAQEVVHRWSPCMALAVVVLATSPISLLSLHLVTFWKDVWVLIGMVWSAVIALWLMQKARDPSPAWFIGMIAFLLVSHVAMVVRHNAVVLLPFYSVLFAVLVARVYRPRYALVSALVPVLLYVGGQRAVNRCFHVQHNTLSSCEMTIELMRLCIRHSEVRRSLGYTAQYMPDDEQLAPHAANYTSEDLNRYFTSDPAMFDSAAVRADYWSVARAHPIWLCEIKLLGFLAHFSENGCLKVPHMHPNDFGLELTPRWSIVRSFYWNTAFGTFNQRWLSWVFVRHSVWFVAAIAGVIGAVVAWRRQSTSEYLTVAILLSCPVVYCLSYVVFSPCADFRYMYPSTLFMQTVAGAALVCCAGAYADIALLASGWLRNSETAAPSVVMRIHPGTSPLIPEVELASEVLAQPHESRLPDSLPVEP